MKEVQGVGSMMKDIQGMDVVDVVLQIHDIRVIIIVCVWKMRIDWNVINVFAKDERKRKSLIMQMRK